MGILKELFSQRGFVFKLAKNDFKTKYAGSIFGIFWAFVQPVVTIMIYVFVFGVGFKQVTATGEYPYVLTLIAGIVPWFFFAESLMGATNCLLEYSYLVKKVVFKISVLPAVKIISSLFVHIFFVFFALVVYMINGKYPTIHLIQVIYYMFSCICLILALSYFTASVVPFFKDFYQIINIFLQIGMWLCPIMWSETMISERYRWILKLNPMYYIVQGYRDSFMNEVWVWQRPMLTLYFWGAVIVIFFISLKVFKRLRVHFSDVL